MTPTISTPAFREELQERGAVLMTEGQAILDLARSLGRFEDATGQRLGVVDALELQAGAALAAAMAETITEPESSSEDIELVDPEPFPLDAPVLMQPPPAAPDPLPLVEPVMPPEMPEVLADQPEPAPEDEAAKSGSPWSSEEKAAAITMKGDGFSSSHIAKVLRRPLRATQQMLAALSKAAEEPEPQADPAPPAPQPAQEAGPVPDASFPKLTGRQQRLVDHVGRLPDVFEPTDDLWLVEAFAKGSTIDVIADQLGCDTASVRARFRAMLTDEITTPKGMITIEGQADLLVALRYRAGA